MNTYRVYILNTAQPLAPVVAIAYVRGAKYGDAWKASNALLNGETPEGGEGIKFFSDPDCKVVASDIGTGRDWKTAKVEDMKPRNVKMDTTKLAAILADPKLSPQAKVKAMQELAGAQAPAPAAAA